MEALIGVAGFVFVAAVTPGPNNFVVMREAVRSGFVGAFPAVGGVVAGTLTLLGITASGVGAVFAAEPRLRTAVAVGGCLYLSWLGARIIAGSFGESSGREDTDAKKLPTGVAGLFGFQFLNPKGWAMVLTATSAVQAGAGALTAFVQLAALFTVVTTACLILWAWLGAAATKYLDRPPVRAWFERAMGALLILSAILVLLGA